MTNGVALLNDRAIPFDMAARDLGAEVHYIASTRSLWHDGRSEGPADEDGERRWRRSRRCIWRRSWDGMRWS